MTLLVVQMMDSSMAWTRENEEKARVTLAQGEMSRVRCFRIITIVVLISVTVIASVGVYFYSHHEEEANFENDFASEYIYTVTALWLWS